MKSNVHKLILLKLNFIHLAQQNCIYNNKNACKFVNKYFLVERINNLTQNGTLWHKN
jgi:hypothetical protein